MPVIWEIIQYAIWQRKKDGSDQWQHGYPNETTIQDDLDKGYAYVVTDENEGILAYAAIIFDKDMAYENIKGSWLSSGDYAVVHRIAASKEAAGKRVGRGLLLLVEELCLDKKVYSIRIDTNFDNIPMLKILEKLDYTYCGEVQFEGPRKAFEKVLTERKPGHA